MDFELNSDGTFRTQPVLGWTTALMPMNALVRLDLLRPDNSLDAIQFHLTAVQCRELAQALLRKAEQLDAQRPDTPPQ